MRARTLRLWPIGLLLALALPASLLVLGTAEAQQSVCQVRITDDRDDDIAPGQDILEACVEVDGTVMTLAMRTREAAEGFWWVEIEVAGQPFEALAEGEGPQGVIVVESSSGQSVCDATSDPGTADGWRYIRDLDLAECFGETRNPIAVRFNSIGRADTAPDGTLRRVTDEAGQVIEGPLRDLRLAGPDRFATSAAVARYAFPDGADEVYLARADNPADALSGGSLPFGPVLLVPQCGTLPDPIREAITALSPQRVIALGGPAAVCDAILQEANSL